MMETTNKMNKKKITMKQFICRLLFAVGLIFAFLMPAEAQTNLYVDGSVSSSGAGTSWGTAYKYLSDALTVANAGAGDYSINIAQGTYYPTSSGTMVTNRASGFTITRKGISLYGGYQAGGVSRNTKTFVTTLSGDIGTLNTTTDNLYHVLIVSLTSNTGGSSSLEGLTIKNGYSGDVSTGTATVYNTNSNGDGRGGGLVIIASTAITDFFIKDCLITSNTSYLAGGGFFSSKVDMIISGCFFVSNVSSSATGGGATISSGNVDFINDVFASNTASGNGGAILAGGNNNIINCTFISNTALRGGAIRSPAAGGATVKLYNNIFYGNTSTNGGISTSTADLSDFSNGDTLNTLEIKYCYLQVAPSTTGTFSNNTVGSSPGLFNAANPLGADGYFGTVDDGARITASSACLNNGLNDPITNFSSTYLYDITGANRIANTTIDKGGYEISPNISVTTSTFPSLDICINGTSPYNTFSVSAADLSANLTITAPTGFQVSTATGSGYASSVTLTPTSGSVSATNVYVKLTSTAVAGSFSGNISLASTGATTKTLAVVGVVAATSLGGSISGGASVCSGTNSTVLTLSGHTGSITKWQSATNAGFTTGLTDIANTATTYTASNLTTTTYYRAVITSGACSSANSATATVTVNALPTPTFTAQPGATACASTDVTYTTQASQTNYVWTVPGTLNTDYTITSGGIGTANNTVTLKWLTTGSKAVTINYTNANGCTASSATSSTATTVSASPTPTFTAQPGATASVSTSVTYTTEAGQASYIWTVPGTLNTDYSITSGGVGTASNTVTLKWLTAGSKTVTINYTNSNSCTAASATSSTATTVITLDQLGLSGIASAVGYSVRKLSSNYSGPLVRIYNGSNFYDVYPDATTGWIASTSFISASIATYNADISAAGSTTLSTITDATVAVWYDQSGNARHIYQATTANQPTIIASSIIKANANGKPAVYFNGSSTFLKTTAAASWINGIGYSIIAVLQTPGSVTSHHYVIGTNDPATNHGLSFGLQTNTTFTLAQFGNDANYTIPQQTSTTIASAIKYVGAGGSAAWLNGTSLGTNIKPNANLATTGVLNIGTGNNSTGNYWIGLVSEMLIFPNELSTANRQTVESNQATNYSVSLQTEPIISSQPSAASQSICLNTTASSLVVAASVSSGTIGYQWYKNATNSNTAGGVSLGSVNGAQTNTFTPVTSVAGTTYYYCILTSSTFGFTSTSAVSGAITVNALPIPTFTVQPGASACVSTDVTYTTEASQTNYVWTVPGTLNTDYTITSGGVGTTSNTVTLKWLTTGSKMVTINYTNVNGCTAASATSSTTTTVNGTPTTANAGADQTGSATCGLTSVTLAANAPTVGTGAWSIVSGTGGTITSPSSEVSTFSGTAGSTYTLRWTVSNSPCAASTDEVVITFNQSPTINSQSTAAQTLCQNATASPITVTATDAGAITYQWYSNASNNNTSGTTLGTATGARTATYTPLTTVAGTSYYYCVVTNPNGCTATSSVSGAILVNAFPTMPTISASGAVTFCAGGSVTLTSSAGSTYLWSTGATSQGISVSSAGSYAVTISDANGCVSSSVSTAVSVIDYPTVSNITGNDSLCENASITLANVTPSGVWSSLTPALATINASTGVVSGVSPGASTMNYTVTNYEASSGSVLLNGSNQSLSLNPGIGPMGSGAFTFECWFKFNSTPPGRSCILGTGTGNYLSINVNGLTEIETDAYFIGRHGFSVPTMSLNTWYHLAVVRNSSGTETIFLNGVRSSSGAVADSKNYNGPSKTIGYWEGGSYFPGNIASIRAVVGSSVYDPNQSNITVPSFPLSSVANTKFLLLAQSSASLLTDASGIQTVTNNNSSTWSSSSPTVVLGCSTTVAKTVTINPVPTATISGTTAVCLNSSSPNITFTGTGATAPYTFSYKINGGATQTIVTTSGSSVTVAAPTNTSGSFAYSLVSVQESSTKICENTASGTATITINPLPTITTTGTATAKCISASAQTTSLVYSASTQSPSSYSIDWDATANTAGLADQGSTSYSFVAGGGTLSTIAITAGTPVGTYNGTMTLTNANGCTVTQAVTVTLTPNNSITLSSSAGTNAQTASINIPMTNITYTTTGATGASFSGLPAGISGSWSSNSVTISGTPSAAVNSSYTVTLTGGCGSVTTTGTITVLSGPSAVVLSGTTGICIGSTANLKVTVTGGSTPYTVVYRNDSTGTNTTLTNYVSGTNIPLSPSSTTSYSLVSVTDFYGNAGSGLSGTPTITLYSAPTAAVLSGSATICSGSSTKLRVAITGGTSPFIVVYQDSLNNQFTKTDYLSDSVILVTPTIDNSRYTLVSVTSTGGCIGTGNRDTARIVFGNVWIAGPSGDWNLASNWCAGVVPSGTTVFTVTAANTTISSPVTYRAL